MSIAARNTAGFTSEASPPIQSPSRGLRIPNAHLLSNKSGQPQVISNIHLVFDHRGVGVARSATKLPRIMPWELVRRARVEPWVLPEGTPGNEQDSAQGSLIILEGMQETYTFLAMHRASELAPIVDGLFVYYTQRLRDAAEDYSKTRSLLVMLLVIGVSIVVTIILLQSAGAISL